MEQSNKNITNADTSQRERNLAKENKETQQENINDENISKVFGYQRGLAFRGTEEVFDSPHNGNSMGALELC
ncbi:hypothetical protein TNCV_1207191 [Trichonephila clavipes]|nr:hypothetical protein TNCV_1207191 [Trichonephila clavipes]